MGASLLKILFHLNHIQVMLALMHGEGVAVIYHKPSRRELKEAMGLYTPRRGPLLLGPASSIFSSNFFIIGVINSTK